MLLKHMKTDPPCTFPSITLFLDGLATELLRQTCKEGLIFVCIAAYVSSNLKVAQIEEISEKCTSLGKVVFTGSL